MGLLNTIARSLSNINTVNKDYLSPVSEVYSWQDYSHLTRSGDPLLQAFGWTWKANDFNANAILEYSPKLRQKKGEEFIDVEEAKNPMLRDWNRFNAFQSISEARYIIRNHVGYTGEAFVVIRNSSEAGYIKEFFILAPTRMMLKLDKTTGFPIGYTYRTPQGDEVSLDYKDVIHFKIPSGANWYRGWGPLSASRYSHTTWEEAKKFNLNFFANMARPEAIIAIEGANNADIKRLEVWLKRFKGTRNAGKTAITNGKVSFSELTKTQKDLQYREGMDQLRDEILVMNGVPVDLLGIGGSTFANAAEAQRTYQRYTIKPFLTLESSVLNEQLIPKYYENIKANDYLQWYFDNPVEADRLAIAQEVQILRGKQGERPTITLNEAREKLGMEKLKDPAADLIEEVVQQNQPVVEDNIEDTTDEDAKKQMSRILDKLESMDRRVKALADTDELEEIRRKDLKDGFLVKNLKGEKTFKKQINEYFDEQLGRLLGSASKTKAVNLNTNIDKEEEVDILIKSFTTVFQTLGEGFSGDASALLDAEDTGMSKAGEKKLKKNLEYFAKEINETTYNKLVEVIAQGINSNMSETEIGNAIRSMYEGFKEGRADTIARTEVNKIKNLAMNDRYDQDETVKGREWLAASDADVRPAHVDADGQVRSKGKPFRVGGENLEYPGDPAGSAENTINCRCTLIPVV